MGGIHIWTLAILLRALSVHISNAAANVKVQVFFSQEWLGTACIEANLTKCITPERWAIKGIWPKIERNRNKDKCKRELPFHLEELKSISSEIASKWSNVKSLNHEKFLQYEWEEYGVCTAGETDLNTERKYFQKALELHDKFDIKSILGAAGITPGNNYERNDIISALHREVGFVPRLACFVNKETNKQYLQEVRLCYDKNMKLTKCGGGKTYAIVGCPLTKRVEYPVLSK